MEFPAIEINWHKAYRFIPLELISSNAIQPIDSTKWNSYLNQRLWFYRNLPSNVLDETIPMEDSNESLPFDSNRNEGLLSISLWEIALLE